MTSWTGGTKLGAWLAIGGVFLAGALGGAAAVTVLGNEREEGAPESVDRLPGPQRGLSGRTAGEFGRPDWFVRALDKHVDLSDEQEAQIREILARREQESRALFESIKPEMDRTLEQARADVRALLTDEQQAGMDEYVAQARDRYHKERSDKRDGRGRRPNP